MSFPRVAIAMVFAAMAFGCRPRNDRPADTTAAEPPKTASSFEDSLKSGDITPVEAFLTQLDSTANGRALVEMRFDPSPSSDRTITVRPDNADIQLRDDGRNGDRQAKDGVFSGTTTLNSAQFGEEMRRASATRLPPTVPVFAGRVMIGRRELNKNMLIDFRNPRTKLKIPLFPFAFVDPALKDHSLMINATAVVTDPARTFDPCTGSGTAMGKWTFGHLMTEMANQSATGVAPADFVRQWLAKWETAQTANTFSIPARLQIQNLIINPWLAASGGTTLDLAKAPFRLLAIVNRVDLRQNTVYGGGSGGEARFVFGAVDKSTPACNKLRFTVIFEYGVKVKSCPDLKVWAKKWYDLKGMTPGDPAYLAALEGITDIFSSAGADPSKLPNKSGLNQLRTNEIALSSPWELREFRLGIPGGVSGHLTPVTVKQEPDASFNNSATLAAYVNANAAAIVQDRHTVPEIFNAAAFLGSRSPVPFPPSTFFWGKGSAMTTPNSRFHLSLNTCSGCHAGETGTQFTHVDPLGGPPAGLSQFLTGTTAPGIHDPDPSDTDNSDRMFGDLDRRALDLDGLVNSPCIRQLGFRPIFRMSH